MIVAMQLVNLSNDHINIVPSISRTEKNAANEVVSNQQQSLPKNTDLHLVKEVERLRARDREVRAHEQAHASAAAGLSASAPQFTFVTGPDGRRYAAGGEVNIDVSPVAGDPQATLRKAEQIRRAALAPAHPSAQDQSVAASAAAMASKARAELTKYQEDKDQTDQAVDVIV